MVLFGSTSLSQAFQEEPLLWCSVILVVVVLAVILIPVITLIIQKKRIAASIYQPTDNFDEVIPDKIAIPNYTPEDEKAKLDAEQGVKTIEKPEAEVAAAVDAADNADKTEKVIKVNSVETSDEDVSKLFNLNSDNSPKRSTVAYESLRKAKLKLSFKAKLRLAPDELKEKYSALVNVILSYKGVKEHMNRPADKFRLNKTDFLKFKIVGKKFNMFLALDVADAKIAELAEKLDATKGFKKGAVKKGLQLYTFSIKNDKGWRNAESAIVDYLTAKDAVKETRAKKLPNINYVTDLPRKSMEELLKDGEILSLPETLEKYLNRGLTTTTSTEAKFETSAVNPEIERMRLEIEAKMRDGATTEFATEFANAAFAEKAEVVKDESADNAAAMFAEMIAATKEAPVVEKSEVKEVEPEKTTEPEVNDGYVINKKVLVGQKVEPYEEKAKVEEQKPAATATILKVKAAGRYPTVDLAQIAQIYPAGYVVDLQGLKRRNLVHREAKGVKILGNNINVALIINANDFSEPAKQAIVKAGGKYNIVK